MIELYPSCIERACDLCCRRGKNKNSGALITIDDPAYSSFSQDELETRDGLTFLKKSNGVCTKMKDKGCGIWDKPRPSVCSDYPYSLYNEKLMVSTSCPWVLDTLLPEIANGADNETLTNLKELKYRLINKIPKELVKIQSKDKDLHLVKIEINV